MVRAAMTQVRQDVHYEPLDRRSGLSLREFKRDYLNRKPVVLTDGTKAWKARSSWTLEGFKARFGDSTVLAAGYENGSYHPSRAKKMLLAEYIDKILTNDFQTYPYYLRDNFSLFVEHKDLWREFSEPEYCFDWFKLLPNFMLRPGPRIFIGPPGCVTNLHQDMWGTHFWMAHLAGRKRWILFPPDQSEFLYPCPRNGAGVTAKRGPVLYQVHPHNPDLEHFPLFEKAKGFEVTVEPGELIIVPSNWSHWVVSIDPTISLTHNYMGPGNFGSCLKNQVGWYVESHLQNRRNKN
jgi:Cupin-like domain